MKKLIFQLHMDVFTLRGAVGTPRPTSVGATAGPTTSAKVGRGVPTAPSAFVQVNLSNFAVEHR